MRRVNAATCGKLKSLRRNRRLETAFHSLTTTFARHCEVKVPDLLLRLRAENLTEPVRSRTPSLRSVFEAEAGRIRRPLPVVLRRSPALLRFHSISTPLKAFFKALRIKAFNRAPLEEACPTEPPLTLRSPRLSPFGFGLGSPFRMRFVPPD